MEVKKRRISGKTIAAILAGILAGTVLISPAGAHFRKRLSHLTNHMKSTFYTESEANGRYANSCQVDVSDLGQMYATGMVEESLVTSNFDDTALQYWFSCWGPVTVRQMLEGHYQVDLEGMSDPAFPNALPVVQVTGIGQGVNASYQWTNVADHGVVIDVWLKDLAGNPSSSDFTFSLLAVLDPTTGVTPTRVHAGGQPTSSVGKRTIGG